MVEVAPKGKIRVLHLLFSLGVGGTERRVLRLGLGLDPARYEVHALTVRPVVGDRLSWPSERHVYFPISPGFHFWRLLELARHMRAARYDVVHTHNWATMFYGVTAARLAGVPVVLHGEHGRNDADRGGVPWRREVVAALLARWATRVVAVNEAIAADVKARWKLSTDAVVCQPNGVDLQRFMPLVHTRSSAGALVIGTVARFDSIKNLPCLVRAFERLKAGHQHLALRLVLVGDGPQFEAVRQLAMAGAAAASIEFVGSTNSPEQWYPRLDVFVNTSFSEGMSNSVLEAMACGVPVVASAIPGNLCWLQDEHNALFFPSDDDQALAAQLLRLATDAGLRQRLAAENLRRARAEYDNRQFITRYGDLYQQLVRHT